MTVPGGASILSAIGTNIPLGSVGMVPIVQPRNPTTADVKGPFGLYILGQPWVNSLTAAVFLLGSFVVSSSGVVTATWTATGSTGVIVSITGDSGGAEVPDGGGNFNLLGTANQVTTTGGTNSQTISLIGPYTPSTYTAHSVLVGEGTSSIVGVATSATSGVPLVSQGSSSDPHFGTAVVAGGGTGATTLTAHGVLLGQGTSAVTAVSPDATSGIALISQGSTTDPAYGTVVVAGGGTGAATLTGLVVGNGTSAMTTTSYTAAGSFTPAITLGTPGSSSFTYGTVVGRYTQLGAVVYFVATIPWTAFTIGSGSGTLSVNLPVTAGAFANAGQVAISSSSGIDIASETAHYPVNFVGVIGTGATSVLIQAQEQGSSQGATALFSVTAAQLASGGGSITLSGFYFAA